MYLGTLSEAKKNLELFNSVWFFLKTRRKFSIFINFTFDSEISSSNIVAVLNEMFWFFFINPIKKNQIFMLLFTWLQMHALRSIKNCVYNHVYYQYGEKRRNQNKLSWSRQFPYKRALVSSKISYFDDPKRLKKKIIANLMKSRKD